MNGVVGRIVRFHGWSRNADGSSSAPPWLCVGRVREFDARRNAALVSVLWHSEDFSVNLQLLRLFDNQGAIWINFSGYEVLDGMEAMWYGL